MEDKIKSQLTDSGAVIGYRPDLQYSKSISSNNTVRDSINDNTENYSQTVKSFLENLPSTVIMDIADTIETIDDIIDNLKEELETNDISFSSSVIPVSIIPDIISILAVEKERLELLNDVTKMLYYGNTSLSDEAYKKKDEELVSKISTLEESEKLNYLTLSYDSLQLKSTALYVSQVDSAILKIEQVAYETDDTQVTNKHLMNDIETLYKEVDEDTKDRIRTYDVQQSKDTMKKSLYNYYLKRNSLKDYYNTVITCATDGSYLLNKLDKYDDNVKQAIEEINKTYLGNIYYLNSIESLVSEKQHLISLYTTLSYN